MNVRSPVSSGSNFIGYCSELSNYRDEAHLVIGMGRSILEFMFYDISVILVGYKGIEILDTIDSVVFASKYNFSGRKIYNNKSISEVVKCIPSYMTNKNVFSFETTSFLRKEYESCYFNSKYFKEIEKLESSKVTVFELLNEYRHLFFSIKLKRKINRFIKK